MTLGGVLVAALLGALWLKPDAAVETKETLEAGTRNGISTPGEEPEASAPGAAGAPAGPNDVPKLRLDRAGSGEGIHSSLRNLFNYTKSPGEFEAERAEARRIEQLRVEAEKRRKEEADRLAKLQAERAEQERLHPTPPPEPPAPPITVRLIGLLGPSKQKVAILSDGGPGSDVYVVKVGDTFADRYKLLSLDYESVTVGYSNPKWSHIPPRTLRIGG
jgi:hypothetical protein